MIDKDRNWWLGMLTMITVLAVIVWAMVWLAAPAGGDQPERAGHAVMVERASGVHIGRGLILTAAHVVAASEDGETLTVTTDSGTEFQARVLWTASTDIALLQAIEPQALAAVDLDCRLTAIGEHTSATGQPMGKGFTTTWGRISGHPRDETVGKFTWRDVVPVNGFFASGISGAGVLDETGRLVGVAVGSIAIGTIVANVPVPFGWMIPAPVICDLLAR